MDASVPAVTAPCDEAPSRHTRHIRNDAAPQFQSTMGLSSNTSIDSLSTPSGKTSDDPLSQPMTLISFTPTNDFAAGLYGNDINRQSPVAAGSSKSPVMDTLYFGVHNNCNSRVQIRFTATPAIRKEGCELLLVSTEALAYQGSWLYN